MSRREAIEEILSDVLPRLEALQEDSMGEIREAQGRADANVERHDAGAEELAVVESEIARMTAEREALPNRAYRAGFDGREEEEEELKARYRNLGPAIASLEERRGELRAEMARLNPGSSGHDKDCLIGQYAAVAQVANDARRDLEGLRDRLTRALDSMVAPVARTHDNTRATVQQLSTDRNWALSPAGRGGIRS